MDIPATSQITADWPIEGPLALARPERGTNSDSWRVTSPMGEWFLRRVTDERRWTNEHAIRAALNMMGLPFAVPRTMPTRTGEPSVIQEAARFELTERIPGRHPRYGNLGDARTCGAALAILDLALATINPEVTQGTASGDQYVGAEGSFATAEMLETAFPGHPDVPGAMITLDKIAEQWAATAPSLPRQLVHADPYASNMLMVEDRVTGILDFEFCVEDARIVDLAAALSAFATQDPQRYDPWPVIEALSGGYQRQLALTPVEISAVPLAIMRREALSLTHWTSLVLRRHREGRDQGWRPTRLVQTQAWTTANASGIVAALSR